MHYSRAPQLPVIVILPLFSFPWLPAQNMAPIAASPMTTIAPQTLFVFVRLDRFQALGREAGRSPQL